MPDSTFSAMTSAAFTTGCYGLRTYKGKDGGRHETTLHKLAQQGKWCEMRECLPEFNNGGKYPGLTTCREAERQLCLKGWGSMRWTFPLMIVALLAFLSVAAVFYRIQYQGAEEALRQVELEAESRKAEIEQLNHQIQAVTALDRQHTRELENDKKRIAQLERDVADGRRRLQVSTTCPDVSARAAARMDDATRARPTDAAQRNYFTLRRRIEIAEEQINGLQNYVRQPCFNN